MYFQSGVGGSGNEGDTGYPRKIWKHKYCQEKLEFDFNFM
jgi:hypothetical protein